MRYLIALVMASSVLLIASCGSSSAPVAVPSSQSVGSPQQSAGSSQPSGSSGGSSQQPSGSSGSSPQQPAGDAVTGTISWPNEDPAANTQVFWYLGGFSSDSPNPLDQQQVPPDGSYSLTQCPCSDLVGYLYLPAAPDATDPLNGGRACWIILLAQGTYSGIAANPGDMINWQAVDMPCSTSPFRSDPSDVQSEIQLLNSEISNPGGDQTVTAGTWQDAESRANNGT